VQAPELAERIPPGQIATSRWPVLHQGVVPPFDRATWDFRVWGLVETPRVWSWQELTTLPMAESAGDLHCVTRWSSLDHQWRGVAARSIAEIVRPTAEARFVMLQGEGGYAANLSLAAFLATDVLLATHHNGEPLTPEHGGPLRAVAPGRYAWKSVKWLRGLEFLRDDQPGFWEAYGYSNSADPWREERFQS
jgi:DMSO/TMAO reductase YedYZ molybdopterin-dependent catalytic subunit